MSAPLPSSGVAGSAASPSPSPASVAGATPAAAAGAASSAAPATATAAAGSGDQTNNNTNESTNTNTTNTNFVDADPSTMADDPRVEQVVLAYLKRRGFTQAEAALRAESKANTATAASAPSGAVDIHTFAGDISLDQHTHLLKQILTYSIQESTPDVYTVSFETLKKWMSECIDVYRPELYACLWPIYAHIFIQLIHRGFPWDAHKFLSKYRAEHEMLHKSELLAFQNLTTDSDLQKCDIVRWFLQRKVEIPMSSFAHQLLISFLEENNYLLLLKIVNEHLHIKIMSRKPLQLEGDMSSSSVNGTKIGQFDKLNPIQVSHLNTTPIRWGALPEFVGFATEAQATLRNKLREQQLNAKQAKLDAEKARGKDKDDAKDDKDGDESAAKKARTDDVASSPTDGSAATSGAQDVDMVDANDDGAAGDDKKGAGDAKAKSTKTAKKKEGETTTSSASLLKETKEEKDMIEKMVKKAIKVPEAMALVKKEDQSVKLPPITSEARLRYLADLNFRAKLSPSSLPSIAFYTFLNSTHTVNSIRISGDASLVSVGMSDSTVRLYDLRDPTIRQSTNPVTNQQRDLKEEMGVGIEPENDMIGNTNIITGTTFINRRLGDEETRLPYTKLVGHSGPVYSTSLSPEGQHLLSASEDCTVRLWHLETKRNLVIYKGHNYPVWDVAFAPLGYYFATASHDSTARLWATNQIGPLRMFVGHTADVDVVKFHPNCNYIATGSSDATARLWDIQTGECVRVFVGDAGVGVRSLAMDPEGRYCATGAEDGKVRIWDLGTGRQVTSYHAHQQAVTSLEYSADGDILAAGSLDYSITMMEARKPQIGEPIRTFKTRRTPVHYLHFTPRNLLLAAGVFNA